MLVGNKCDRDDRKVSFDEGQKLAKEFSMQFFETSAKSNYNVNETFTYLTREILNNTDSSKPSGKPVPLDLKKDKDPKTGKKECCK